MNKLSQLKKDLHKLATKKRAEVSKLFFKTGKGEYGEGDRFIGITVPNQRKIGRKYKNLPFSDIQELLKSKIHEYRLTGLLILVNQYEQNAKIKNQKTKLRKIFNFYLKNTRQVNNWDLVDLSAPNIVGQYLTNYQPRSVSAHPKRGVKNRDILYKLARSENIWERRMAIVATYAFIKLGEFSYTIRIARILLKDDHNLIHKAVGWMLREVGKRDQAVEEMFLKKYYKTMPRTMLRYAIEKFSEKKRKWYMKK